MLLKQGWHLALFGSQKDQLLAAALEWLPDKVCKNHNSAMDKNKKKTFNRTFYWMNVEN